MSKPVEPNTASTSNMMQSLQSFATAATKRSVIFAGAGALATQVVSPLAMQGGALIGLINGAAVTVAQKLVGTETKSTLGFVITAATLAATFFGMTHAAAAPLLGRVGINLTKDVALKMTAFALASEVVHAVIFGQSARDKTPEKQVAALTKEEVTEHFKTFQEDITKTDEKPAKIADAFVAPLMARFAAEGLYKAPTTKKEVAELKDHEVEHFFGALATIAAALKSDVRTDLDERFVTAKLPAQTPKDRDAVEAMTLAQLYFAFENHKGSAVETHVAPLMKKAFETAKFIPNAPTNIEAANKLTVAQAQYFIAEDLLDATGDEEVKKAVYAKADEVYVAPKKDKPKVELSVKEKAKAVAGQVLNSVGHYPKTLGLLGLAVAVDVTCDYFNVPFTPTDFI